MIIYAVIALSLLAAVADIYIYRRIIRRRWSPLWKILYKIYAVVAELSVVAVPALLYFYPAGDFATAMKVSMWILALFFLNAVPKVAYMALSLIDLPLNLLWHRRRTIFGWIGAAVALYAFCTMFWGMTLGRSRIEVKRVELTFQRLPEAFDGLRVVEFTDLHMGNLINRDRFLRRMVDSINSLQPDIVVQCGDIVNLSSGELDSAAMRILSGIEARHGVWAVMGNHDLGFYIRDTTAIQPHASITDLRRKQASMGWKVLVNEREYIRRGADSITIAGVNYPAVDSHLNSIRQLYSGADIPACRAGVPDSLFSIMLSHTPTLWSQIDDGCGADLTLSGHVHAMQMKFGIGRAMWSPAKLMYEQWSGLYERGGKYLYINDGAGYVMYPMRINTRPEVTLITLRRK